MDLTSTDALQNARALYRARQWGDAETLCARVLERHPQDLQAIELLGLIAARTHRAPLALELLGRLVTARPDVPFAHNNYANVLKLLGRFAEALQSYDRALQIDPEFAEAHNNRGDVLRRLGRLDEALQSHERAVRLRPGHAEAHNNRGNTLQALGRLDEALQSHEQALRLKPELAEAHNNRGAALQALGRLDEAVPAYERALQLDPEYAEAYNNRSSALQALGQIDAALQGYRRALQLRPGLAEAHSNLGNALQALGRFGESLQSYRRALELNPNLAEAHGNCGKALQALGRREEALQSYREALQIKPYVAESHSNLGTALQELGHLPEARQSYEHALKLNPAYADGYSNLGAWHIERNELESAIANLDRAISIRSDFAAAHLNRAYAHLLSGDFANGWPDYEWRWKMPGRRMDPRYSDDKRWSGRQPVMDKTIVLHGEQGLGDTLQFSRYVSQVASLGARVILEVPSPLAALLANLEGLSRVVVRGDPLPEFDHHCPLVSLPLAFGTTLASIPARVPYLVSDAAKRRFWAEKLGPRTKPRVGLVWSGGFRPDQPELWAVNGRRNVPLAKLAMLRHAEIDFYSLQKGEPAESELEEVKAAGWPGPDLIDFTPSLRDFADTAALVDNLDLVIAVDTSTAHLAGALGKPVWIMNRFDSCWRWLLERTDSPWYPTARLYRQRHPGDWDEVVERIRTDLSADLPH
jgi:tetratricopeptide (TPR) repeat protein